MQLNLHDASRGGAFQTSSPHGSGRYGNVRSTLPGGFLANLCVLIVFGVESLGLGNQRWGFSSANPWPPNFEGPRSELFPEGP